MNSLEMRASGVSLFVSTDRSALSISPPVEVGLPVAHFPEHPGERGEIALSPRVALRLIGTGVFGAAAIYFIGFYTAIGAR